MRSPDALVATFREEAAELVAEFEAALLELERRPDDAALVDRAFRAMHTIKGSGGMFGLAELAAFTHELESAFDAVRTGRLRASRELVSAALEAKDHIRALVEGAGADAAPARAQLVTRLRRHLYGPEADTPAVAPGADASARTTYRVRFRPHPGLFEDGTNPLGILAELRAMGGCEIVARVEGVPALEDLSPERCHLGWDLTLTTDAAPAAIRDVFIFVEDRSEVRIEELEARPDRPDRLGELLVERGELSPDALARTLAGKPRIGELLVEGGLVAPGAVAAALQEQKAIRQNAHDRAAAAAPATPESPTSSIRVAAEKLDRLVDLVGELVIAQARLSRIAAGREDPELLAVSEDIDRLSTDLRDGTLDVRMVPIGTTFNRFRRLVRDLSTDLGKEIDLVTEGAETELDKTVIERLGDPLVHLLRNSCDHGVEAPEARRAAGKPPRGTVRLSAFHAGASVIVELRDDGAGMDPEAILTRAIERGLVTPDARPPDRELFQLVFLAGFSTARAVTNLSGRGVGMDVVKRSIEALGGSVALESTRGIGTTVRIRLPLTLAIIEGLLVTAGEETYVLPLSAVEECVELTRADVERGRGARVAAVRGELVPYLRLRELFEVPGPRPDVEQIAIVRHEEGRCGVVVDGVVGQHQTVIKSLNRVCRDVKGVSGATILGDGTVALIVDVPGLVAGALAA
jgi:two-component system chemotaxis sensor kinase CheA